MRFLSLFWLLVVVQVAQAAPPADVRQAPLCQQCSMDRAKFSHSRMVVTYRDGSTAASCSLHCVAVELANSIAKVPVQVRVADYDTKELLDAETAVWVLGGSKKGVMTGKGKWAFAERVPAERFISENGGRITNFDEVIKSAYEDMYEDTKMIREFREMNHARQHGTSAK